MALLNLKIFEVYRQHEDSDMHSLHEVAPGSKYSINEILGMPDEFLDSRIFKIDYDPKRVLE